MQGFVLIKHFWVMYVSSAMFPLNRYGESEGLLSQVFKAAEALGGAIIFFDELDSLGGNREGGDIHEVSRRMLSVMLR
jgi:ATP-dependent 26S proteasome regulatory subunit